MLFLLLPVSFVALQRVHSIGKYMLIWNIVFLVWYYQQKNLVSFQNFSHHRHMFENLCLKWLIDTSMTSVLAHNYYIYMSSDGPPKRDSPFWRHWTVWFTCLLKSFTCGRRVGKHLLCRVVNQGLYSVELESIVHWCTDFRNLAIAVHASHEVGAVNYGSCCTL